MRGWIRVLRLILDAAEQAVEEFTALLERIFRRRKELLFAAAFSYGVALAIYSLFRIEPEFLIAFVQGKSLPILWAAIAFIVGTIVFLGLRPLFKESSYDETGLQRQNTELAEELSKLRSQLVHFQRRGSRSDATKELALATEEIIRRFDKSTASVLDLSSPGKIFEAARQRLIEESIRIDKISRRNLYFGIVFSVVALTILGSPLIAQAVFFATGLANGAAPALKAFSIETDVTGWLTQVYLPRFAVALLFQFVGFFFLRLYVANELDLKHNKNEITNFESKMMALQFSETTKTTKIKEQVAKAFADTERNFIIKKNEKIASMEVLAEYNDLKSLIEKVLDKLPTIGNKKEA